ncbi:MAG: tetratricopeptide repeat protein [Bacteroidetes bacterium]|nr:MAG: tetratricopeptide repeat protein [Bacteroidota bacterium]
MKKPILLLIVLLACQFGRSQIKLPAEAWIADLQFLQQTLHKDYPFLFKKITPEQFDAAVETLQKEIPELEEHQIVAGLMRLVSSFEYGHTALRTRGSNFSYHQLPLNLYHFSDGIFIEGAHKDYEQILGAKVLEVEGMPVMDALKAIRPVVPAENDQFFRGYGLSYLSIPEILHAQGVSKKLSQTVRLTLEKGGQVFEQNILAVKAQGFPTAYGFSKNEGDWLCARDPHTTPHYLKNLDKIYYFEFLPEHKTLYVRHSQIQDDPAEAIPAFYKRVFDFIENHEVDKLVLDVRLNGGGNNYKNKPIVTGVIETKKINQPGKFFVVIGRRTFSACQNLVNELENYTQAIFVGEPTAENINFYGDNRQVVLPNSKLPVYLSFAWWQDKPQWENDNWLAPHLAVEMSFEDYRSNKDPVLEAALNFSDENFILDPMEYLQQLFMAGELEKLEAEAAKMANDPRYRFVNFEEQVNRTGYNLLNNNQVKEAIYVFSLNVKTFPNSANCWDSLAEAYWKANQTEKAIEYYNKAIQLDPNGTVGEHARDMLRQIKK